MRWHLLVNTPKIRGPNRRQVYHSLTEPTKVDNCKNHTTPNSQNYIYLKFDQLSRMILFETIREVGISKCRSHTYVRNFAS
jgi:hypothetical protein